MRQFKSGQRRRVQFGPRAPHAERISAALPERHREESELGATLHQRQAELADQRGRVEQEVRTALIELETSIGEVRLAESNRGFANETLREARDRFNAGVTTTVEVVQAQEQVASAESDYFNALFAFDLARITLSRAMGQAEIDLPSLLTGGRP